MSIHEHYADEIALISNPDLRAIVEDTLDASPECIVEIPASSSGRYHPNYSLGEGGLMRHTKAAVGIAKCMIETEIFKNRVIDELDQVFKQDLPPEEVLGAYADAVYAALILHDCKKPDDTEKHSTRFDHPLLAAKLFRDCAVPHVNRANRGYMKVVVPMVYGAIASHMGEWNTAPYAKGIVLPKPVTPVEHFVHMCDYLASRKFLEFNFDVYNKVKR